MYLIIRESVKKDNHMVMSQTEHVEECTVESERGMKEGHVHGEHMDESSPRSKNSRQRRVNVIFEE